MRECICGKPLARRPTKGGREKEYCSDACRQRACRERNKSKREDERIKRAEDERAYQELRQELESIGYPPRAWLVELWQKDLQIKTLKQTIATQDLQIERLQQSSSEQWLQDQLAEKEAEIVRLTVLLESYGKRKRPQ